MYTRKKLKPIFILLLILVSLIYFLPEKNSDSLQNDIKSRVYVSKVHDGDTVSVLIEGRKVKVRLIGIDAPEIGQKPWGGRSKKYLENLINTSGRKITLEFDVEKKDKYNRLLAYLWAGEGVMINFEMLRKGYAMIFTVPPNVKYVGYFRAAQKEAREKKIGIWSKKGLKEKPADYRKENPRQ